MFDLFLKAGFFAFTLCFLITFILIPLLKKAKAGQNILVYVKEHKGKSGTPTMGGIAFVSSAIAAALFFAEERDRLLTVSCAVGLSFMLVGMLDDILKLKHKKNEGLKPYQKIIFQLLLSIILGLFCVRGGYTLVYFPFSGFAIDIGWWMLPLSVFVFIATVNCVNLTDGLDGLAASSSSAYFLSFGLLISIQGEFTNLALLCFCLVGALASYLVFNTNKASIFMGDTGSLALGGFAAAVGIFSGNLLTIAIIGFVFVLSGITVIIQVIYYKKTKRRIFLMAPVHHHFQMKGYSESKIAYAYFVVTLMLGLTCVVFII